MIVLQGMGSSDTGSIGRSSCHQLWKRTNQIPLLWTLISINHMFPISHHLLLLNLTDIHEHVSSGHNKSHVPCNNRSTVQSFFKHEDKTMNIMALVPISHHLLLLNLTDIHEHVSSGHNKSHVPCNNRSTVQSFFKHEDKTMNIMALVYV